MAKKEHSPIEEAYLLLHEVEAYLRIVGTLEGATAEKCSELAEKVAKAQQAYANTMNVIRAAIK